MSGVAETNIYLQLAIRIHQSAGEFGQGIEKSMGTALRPGAGQLHAYKHAYIHSYKPQMPILLDLWLARSLVLQFVSLIYAFPVPLKTAFLEYIAMFGPDYKHPSLA